MTVVVSVNAPGRVRGFLASCMLEVAPGVYTAPDMSSAVRNRIWNVLSGWWEEWPETSLVMTWEASDQPGGQGLRTLGQPPRDLLPTESIVLMRRGGDDSSNL